MADFISALRTKALGENERIFQGLWRKLGKRVSVHLLEKGWILMFIGFLLGRAVILSTISPFAIAYLATIWVSSKDKAGRVLLAILAGAAASSMSHAIYMALAVSVFILLAGIFKHVRHPFIIPCFVWLATIVPRLSLYSFYGELTSYEWMLLAVEGILATILVLIFMQSVPLLSLKRFKPTLKNEEIICMIILFASILTGTIGWELYGASIEQVFSRYLVMMLAFVGGAAIGSTVGVVAGLILSLANVANLYQMSLLAFSGLMGGLLREGKKVGVAIGLLVGTCLVGIYSHVDSLVPSLTESLLAICLFMATPSSWFKKLSRFIPGTEAHSEEQEQYLQKVRHVTAKRVEQFSDVFQALSKSFINAETTAHPLEEQESKRETDYFLSQVTEKTCQSCFMKDRCWQQQFDTTYGLMEDLKQGIRDGQEPPRKLVREFENYCVKSKKVVDVMKEEWSLFEANRRLKQQVLESKRLVAEQLQGVSEVMEDFAKEIVQERKQHEQQELQIANALKQLHIELEKLDIYSLEKGNVDIELIVSFYDYRGEGAKLIAPILSDILHELIVIKHEEISPFPNGSSFLVFGSAREFVVETGVAHAAKDGGIVSGDSYTTMELGTGKYAVAISDGMGNGTRAHEESGETLRLLQQILQTGIPEHVAIKSINSILALRSTDEMFATLDLAVINLHNARVRFLKIGSTPSFIKRGDQLLKVEASNLPMGIIHEFDVDIVQEQLVSGDLLVMMSDGIFEGPKHVERTDLWIKRKLAAMQTVDPQEMADLLLEEVIRTRKGAIEDDMTVLVARVEKYIPEWASIPLYPASSV